VPLGDSINEITCWRALVWDMLADAKYADQVEYVGSQKSNPQNCKPNTANWDQHHEGHSGWLAIDIANNYITKWMASTPADIVMFMLGTNDVVRGHNTADILAAYTKIVNTIRAASPKAKIIVSLLNFLISNPNTLTTTPTSDRPSHPPLHQLRLRNHDPQRRHPGLGKEAQHNRLAHRHRRLQHGLPHLGPARRRPPQPRRRQDHRLEGRAAAAQLRQGVVGEIG
jgi:GDSL-like Lipase/Acylhydrolase family